MGNLAGARPNPRRALRDLLAGPLPVVAPGAYDSLSARLVEQAGFAAVYLTGFGTAAGLLGRPDVGLLGQAEMAGAARRMSQAVDLPVIADADTGYGNPINVLRTVREYEQAGVAGLHLEDQAMPKRCGHMTGKALVPPGEMAAKVRAAVSARTDPDLLLIARTDAVAVEGLDAALDRARRYADAGADAVFVEALTSEQQIEAVAAALPDTPLVYAWVEGGRSPAVPLERLRDLGFALVLFPLGALLAATAGMRALLATLRADGTPAAALPGLPGFDEFCDLVGLDEVRALEQRFQT